MTDSHGTTPREAFARVVRALEPYAHDVVMIGGWVHALLLSKAGDRTSPVYTDDIDVSVPRKLLATGRPTLIELATGAGFKIDPLSELEDSPIRLTIKGKHGTLIDLDILTESPTPREAILIEGQPGLAAQGYPGQAFLLNHTQWVEVGPEIHRLLDPPMLVRIPTIGAYSVHKGLSFATRTNGSKAAKDLVYLFEILRHSTLGRLARTEVRELATESPQIIDEWCQNLSSALLRGDLLREMADQLSLVGQVTGPTLDVIGRVKGEFRRTLDEIQAKLSNRRPPS